MAGLLTKVVPFRQTPRTYCFILDLQRTISPVAPINRPGGLTDGIDQWTADRSKLLAESSNRGPDALFREALSNKPI
jgi:hypothetical protein